MNSVPPCVPVILPGDDTAICPVPVDVVCSEPVTVMGAPARWALALSVDVNPTLFEPAVIVPPVTTMLTSWLLLWSSLTVTVVGPKAVPTGDTLKVAGPGPLPVDGETVAIWVLLLTALKAPV